MKDLDLHVLERVWNKFLKDKSDNQFKITLLTEYKRVLFNISMGTMTLDDAREYLKELLLAYFGDDLQEDICEQIVNELLRVVKLEEIRTRALQRQRSRMGIF